MRVGTRSSGGSRCRRSPSLRREIHLLATATWKHGVILGNRTLRERYRDAISDVTSMGVPANKVGIMISFANDEGIRRAERPRACRRVVPGGEVADARGQAGCGGDGHRVGLVVGLG